MKKLIIAAILVAAVAPLLLTTTALAQPPQQGLNEFLNATQLSNVTLPTAIGRIVRIVLTFLGLIAVVIIILGGFQWMTSGGNEEKIASAKKLMGAGIIGLIIIVLAYAIASFVISSVTTIVNG